ncbi:carbohydrate binding family 9 domain-containing protein [Actomonas aquatica]|uniref:DUF5916 domain-containing protein n=1 Tax=Actomonas aquatica TaxID=2866162 RepID=A0ABZ1C812_9BACT|nr:carbohydrate binding family 9 domain-containing protein [Opitutus sp. WL0086]WRQ87837.1 DUF5916 domain-containing protein [Opitutus sp. WL0086]
MSALWLGAQDDVATKLLELPEATVSISVDGALTEASWSGAAVRRDLLQVEPSPGLPGSERTEVLLLRDAQHLYVGVRAYDREATGILARQLRRDASLGGDDHFVLVVDSIGDRREGYQFSINPRGARYDALVTGQTLNDDWDGIWQGRAQVTATGWEAEMVIPFATLSFRDDGTPWNINFERRIARKNETVRWTAASRNQRAYYLGSAGQMTGMADLNIGLGLDFRPFLRGGWEDVAGVGDDTSLDAGFDLFWKISPTISTALTYNTDFSETEVDDRLINLTRFSTFFPEKRAFFLQDAGVFAFGDQSNSLLPFFSRRIGLDAQGNTVDLRAGLKTTGRTGPFSFGVLAAQTHDTLGNHNLGVARGRFDVLEESTAGFIFTRGDPLGGDKDWLGGIDLNFQTSQWRGGDQTLRLNAYALQTYDDGTDTNAGAYGVGLRYPTDRWSVTTNLFRIDEGFRPALGYVRQRGIYNASGKVVRRWRPANFESIDWGTAVSYVARLDGELDYFEASIVDFTITPPSREFFGASWFVYREAITQPFFIGPGVLVPTGVHDTQRFSAWFGTSSARPWGVRTEVSQGGFYNGESWETSLSLEMRALDHFHLSLDHGYFQVDLPQGEFDIHNAGLRADVLFSPDLNLSLVANWDSLSEDLGANVRLRWTRTPGQDVFLVFNQNISTEHSWRALQTGVSAKAVWSFRF